METCHWSISNCDQTINQSKIFLQSCFEKLLNYNNLLLQGFNIMNIKTFLNYVCMFNVSKRGALSAWKQVLRVKGEKTSFLKFQQSLRKTSFGYITISFHTHLYQRKSTHAKLSNHCIE